MSTKEIVSKRMQQQEQPPQPTVLIDGSWSDGTAWSFVVHDVQPKPEVSTAAFGIVRVEDKIMVVEHAKRGWELPGGHVEPGESVLAGLQRELLEEAGVVISDGQYFGHKKIAPPQPVPHRSGVGQYPFPYSYVPYFVCGAQEILEIPLTEDISQVAVVSVAQAVGLFLQSEEKIGITHGHHQIVQFCVRQGLITEAK